MAFLGIFLDRFEDLASPNILSPFFVNCMSIWYFLTISIIGIWIAVKSFNLVLSWEKIKNGEEEEEKGSDNED